MLYRLFCYWLLFFEEISCNWLGHIGAFCHPNIFVASDTTYYRDGVARDIARSPGSFACFSAWRFVSFRFGFARCGVGVVGGLC